MKTSKTPDTPASRPGLSRREFITTTGFVVTAAMLTGCRAGLPDIQILGQDLELGPQRLPGELEEYQGTTLDYLSAVRENSIAGPQQIDLATYRLTVDGLVDTPLSLTFDQVIEREAEKRVIRLNCIEGWSIDMLWEGVPIMSLLTQAGYDAQKAKIAIFHCYDGYTTSIPVDYVADNDLMIAYEMNGIPLPAERGRPLHVVDEGKYGYKWAKWVTRIELSDDKEFQGYWESRGYDNDADVIE